jgi:ubiquinone/menaquinone biosynthesis C-methylase UbiE
MIFPMPPSFKETGEVKREVRSTFDFISYDYDKLRGRIWEDLADFTTESLFLPKPSRDSLVVDLAGGNARHAIYFTEKNEVRSVAIDFSTQLLSLAKKRVDSSNMRHMVALIDADVSEIPIRQESANDVLFIAAIHHLPTATERLKSMQETRRILVHGGRGVVTVWRKWQRRFVRYFVGRYLRHPLGGKATEDLGDIHIPWKSGHGATSVSRFYHLFSKRELKKLLSKSGFRIIKISKSSKKAGEGAFFASIEKK